MTTKLKKSFRECEEVIDELRLSYGIDPIIRDKPKQSRMYLVLLTAAFFIASCAATYHPLKM